MAEQPGPSPAQGRRTRWRSTSTRRRSAAERFLELYASGDRARARLRRRRATSSIRRRTDPDHFVHISYWEDREDFNRYWFSREMQQVRAEGRRAARTARAAAVGPRHRASLARPLLERTRRSSSSPDSPGGTTCSPPLFSFGQDPRWRKAMVGAVRATPERPGARCRDRDRARRRRARPALRLRGGRARPERADARRRARRSSTPTRDSRAASSSSSGEAEQLPFDDGEFDALTFTYLLRYVDDPAATLRELARVREAGRVDRHAGVRGPRAPPARALWRLYTQRRPAGARARWSRASGTEVGRFLGPSIAGFYRALSARRAWRALASGRDRIGRGASA